jgi:DNA-binding protein
MVENEILVGKKPLMSYVLAVITQFSNGTSGVVVKARGKTISKAVDVAQIVKNKFAKEAQIGPIKIDTEEVEAKEGGKINVSTIEIPINK